jgi:hypothetical protein
VAAVGGPFRTSQREALASISMVRGLSSLPEPEHDETVGRHGRPALRSYAINRETKRASAWPLPSAGQLAVRKTVAG